MIADLKPYSEYKESGVEWLDQIPAHWKLPRLGSVLRERGETNEARQVIQVLSVLKDVGVIPYEDKGNIGNKKSEDIARYKIVRPDDIVVNCMNVIIGSVGLSRYTGCLSPVYYVLTRRSEVDNPRYLNAVFQTKPFQESLVRIGNGIMAHRMRIPMELLKCEPFPVLPPDEQAAIVRFLDYANRRLERTIQAKRKVIALLNEQKQAIIHRAVTRGLNSDIPLKPSGIPWLGEIPAHWEARQLGRFITLQRGFDITKDQQSAGSIPVVSSGGVSSYHSKSTSQGPGVIVGRKGSVGTVHFIEGPYWAHDTTLWVKDFGGHHSKFVYYVLSLLDLKRFDTGSANPTLNRNIVHPEIVVFPPPNEQVLISSYLDNAVARIKQASTSAEREIALLREYRTRLIADVVTGKLDAREAARHLPIETDESDPSEPGDDLNDEAALENELPEDEA